MFRYISYLFDTDSYKPSHFLQYPKGTTGMTSYISARSGEYDYVLYFGIQYILKGYLSYRVTVKDVKRAKAFYAAHGVPFNYEGWMYIAKDLKGKLPIRIRSVKEGDIIPVGNILCSVESTDPKVFWIVSWIETMLLRIWYTNTVATRSHVIKNIIMDALNKSSDDPKSEIDFKLHNFGSRGSACQEAASLSGMAHLTCFKGTDTVVSLVDAEDYYDCEMAGFSIPASEHSSITSWGKEHEVDAYRNMLKQFAKPGALVACVSDSYDLYNAVSNLWGGELRQEIIDSGAVVIIRPDSGHPPTVVLKTVQLLEEKFGTVVNTKGYKVLNHVRVIQGDGINEFSISEILNVLLENGYSATNIAFGMGGALCAKLDRDTMSYAMKCSHIFIGDKSVDVYKDPVTDTGKKSKGGRLDLIIDDTGKYQTVKLQDNEIAKPNSEMQVVFLDGELYNETTFAEIRERVSVKWM